MKASCPAEPRLVFVDGRGRERAGSPADEDLVNAALAHALRHKTKAFAVEANQLPEGAALAGVYWLPIGERRDKRVLASGP